MNCDTMVFRYLLVSLIALAVYSFNDNNTTSSTTSSTSTTSSSTTSSTSTTTSSTTSPTTSTTTSSTTSPTTSTTTSSTTYYPYYDTTFYTTPRRVSTTTIPSTETPDDCIAWGGKCQDYSQSCCGYYKRMLCPQFGPTVLCCIPDDDAACYVKEGVCQAYSENCDGHYEADLCAEPVHGCCIPRSTSGNESISCSKVNIVSRAQWCASGDKGALNKTEASSKVIIHHTQGQECADRDACNAEMRSIQEYHKGPEKGWPDIGYNFLAGGDGSAYEGRGWDKIGAHAKGSNTDSIGIAFMGNYMNILPNADMIAAVKNLIKCGVELGKIKSDYKLCGHRDVVETDCPGNTLYAEIQTWKHYNADC